MGQREARAMYLTTENAAEYVGKVLDASRRMFHYYPLTVGQWPSGKYYIKDRTGTCLPVPAPGDKFSTVFFDTVKEAS